MDPGAQILPLGPSSFHLSAQFSSTLTLFLDEQFPFDCKMVAASWTNFLKTPTLGERASVP